MFVLFLNHFFFFFLSLPLLRKAEAEDGATDGTAELSFFGFGFVGFGLGFFPATCLTLCFACNSFLTSDHFSSLTRFG